MVTNPLFDPSTDNASIANEVQQRLNTPMAASAFSADEQAFLNLLMAKIADGSIQLYSPSSLLNAPVYETLPSEAQGKADQNAVVLLTKIREINDLMQVYHEPNEIVKNLVASLLAAKNRLEEHADIFII